MAGGGLVSCEACSICASCLSAHFERKQAEQRLSHYQLSTNYAIHAKQFEPNLNPHHTQKRTDTHTHTHSRGL